MLAYYSDIFALPLPEGHRFPLPKYALLRQHLLQLGLIPENNLRIAPAATDDQLLRVHTQEYLDKVKQGWLSAQEIRRIGLPWSPELVLRARHSVGGTIAACRTALEDGLSANLAGGTHHAHPGFGSGFCVFNDVAVAARVLQMEGLVKRAVILDCDVHQGDGTAAIFRNDPSVYTFSIHGTKNFPYRKEPSNLDIGLRDGCEDKEYLDALEDGVQIALNAAQADLAIYIAGADPFIGDRLGRIALSKDGLAWRDRLVISICKDRQLPTAIVLGGGYATLIQDSVDIHIETIRIAKQEYDQYSKSRGNG